MNAPLTVLAVETSCDETSVALVRDGREVLSNIISSQIPIHREYGGVVPEIASRHHVELILPVVDEALKTAGLTLDQVDVFAATSGPGLVGALLVGVSAAKSFAFALRKPLIGVHHIEGHIAANYLSHPDLEPPYLCLVASGGHSHIVRVSGYNQFEVVGRTRDDAAGEAFDKVARVLGLGYPGGPEVDRQARQGNPAAFRFPRVQFEGAPWDFSFSGIKTSVINVVHQMKQKNEPLPIPDLCASFQQAVVDVLVDKTLHAAQHFGYATVCLAGGVASNTLLRETLRQRALPMGIRVCHPEPVLCTDNAAMIACAGYYAWMGGARSDFTLNAEPAMRIGHAGKNAI